MISEREYISAPRGKVTTIFFLVPLWHHISLVERSKKEETRRTSWDEEDDDGVRNMDAGAWHRPLYDSDVRTWDERGLREGENMRAVVHVVTKRTERNERRGTIKQRTWKEKKKREKKRQRNHSRSGSNTGIERMHTNGHQSACPALREHLTNEDDENENDCAVSVAVWLLPH